MKRSETHRPSPLGPATAADRRGRATRDGLDTGRAFDVVDSEQVFFGGRPVGMAIGLGDRLQFFTDLDEFRALDGKRFATHAALLGDLRACGTAAGGQGSESA